MASNGTGGDAKLPASAIAFNRAVADANWRGRYATRRIWALAQQLERDLGLRLQVGVTWSVTKADVSESPLDLLLDDATPISERSALLEALYDEHWPEPTTLEVRAKRLRAMECSLAEMLAVRRHVRLDQHEYFRRVPDKRAADLPRGLRPRWFWHDVDARLGGDKRKPRRQRVPVDVKRDATAQTVEPAPAPLDSRSRGANETELPGTRRRQKLTGRTRPASTRARHRRRR